MPLVANLDIDPDTSATDPQRYNSAQDASVAFDRNHNAYVVFREVSSKGDSGEILLQKFDFSSSTPALNPPANANAAGNSSKVVYLWTKAGDTAVSPMIAVDNNVSDPNAVSIDSNSNTFDQTDPWSGNVYVAWATADQLPNGVAANKFNTNIIRLIASSDGGDTFTSPTALSDRNQGERAAEPRLVISQGTQVGRRNQSGRAGAGFGGLGRLPKHGQQSNQWRPDRVRSPERRRGEFRHQRLGCRRRRRRCKGPHQPTDDSRPGRERPDRHAMGSQQAHAI